MINANIYNIIGVVLCLLLCIGVLHFVFKEYEFSLGDDDE